MNKDKKSFGSGQEGRQTKKQDGNSYQQEEGKLKKGRSKKTDKRSDGLQNKVKELEEDLRRERADFTNFRRRSEIDQSQILDTAKAHIVGQLLPVIDDLDRALAHRPEELADNSWVKGIMQVRKEVTNKLNALGAEKIETAGERFDPQLHEAVGFDDGAGEEEVIIEELRPGYMLNGKVLRPAMVRVGKSNDKNKQANKEEK